MSVPRPPTASHTSTCVESMMPPAEGETRPMTGAAIAPAAAGAIAAPVMGLVSPSAGGIMLSTQVLVWLAVGGRGTLIGAFAGAVIVTMGQQYLGEAIGSW